MQSVPNTLDSLQHEVGGDIQAITPYADPVAIIVAEEGKIMGLPFNRAIRDEDNKICDYLVGKFLIVGVGRKISSQSPINSSRSMNEDLKRRSSLSKSARKTVSCQQKILPLFTLTQQSMQSKMTNCRSTESQ